MYSTKQVKGVIDTITTDLESVKVIIVKVEGLVADVEALKPPALPELPEAPAVGSMDIGNVDLGFLTPSTSIFDSLFCGAVVVSTPAVEAPSAEVTPEPTPEPTPEVAVEAKPEKPEGEPRKPEEVKPAEKPAEKPEGEVRPAPARA